MDAMTNVATTHQTPTVDTLDTRSAPGAEMSNIYWKFCKETGSIEAKIPIPGLCNQDSVV